MNKIIIIVLLLLMSSSALVGQNKNLFYNLKNFNGNKAVLFSNYGDVKKPIDTAYRQSTGAFVFFNIQNYPTGIYNVYFNDSIYTEVIINNEDIVISADAKNLFRTIKIGKSIENEILFNYWTYAMMVKDSTAFLNYKKHKIEQRTFDSNHPEIKKIDKQIDRMNKNIDVYIDYQAETYPSSFAPVLLKAYLIPDMDKYNATSKAKKYTSEDQFLKDHFFDNINFNDERFLNTRVIYTSVNDYVETFGKPSSTVNYNMVVDKVLSTAAINSLVYEYCLDIFLRTFENSIFESVLVHIIDDYYVPYYTLSGQSTKYYSHLSERIKALKPGKLAPNIILKDTAGVVHNLYETPAKAKMIVFYSSDCPHCAQALPSLLEIFTMYKEQGLIAYGVAIDEDKEAWKKEIRKFSMNWTSVSDLKGLLSPLMDDYNIKSTPYILILAGDNVIMKKPTEINDIHATLVQLLNDL